MNGNEINIINAKVESYIESKRPALELRSKIDLGFSFEKNTFELFTVRPVWNSPNENDYQKLPFAKFKYIKAQTIWKLYWKRASGKWESYEPLAEASNIESILKCIEKDAFGCFYG